ncbi:MAG: TrbI F-type domain-containing protein [Rickettsiales bacterium]|jgi:hypothetical protein|nr:TrbI F-type domain-containing protein [Rickettsiales bacterium]
MLKDISVILITLMLNVLITVYFLVEQPQQIVVIDNEKIFNEMVLKITKDTEGAGEEEVELEVKKYDNIFKKFQAELSDIAIENNIVVLHKYNVIGGAIDQTEEAKTVLLDLMEKERYVK